MKQVRLITPAPISAHTLDSGLARYFAPTPGIAPVRTALMRLADISASGAPVSALFSMTIKMERGMPFSTLSRLEPYHFSPAILNLPPR